MEKGDVVAGAPEPDAGPGAPVPPAPPAPMAAAPGAPRPAAPPGRRPLVLVVLGVAAATALGAAVLVSQSQQEDERAGAAGRSGCPVTTSISSRPAT